MARSNRTFYFFICASCIVHGMLWFAQEELPVSIPLHKNETTGNSIKISFINPIETGESMIDKEEEQIVSKKNRLPVQWSRQHPAQLNKKNKRLLVVSQEQLAPQSLQDSNLVLNTITQNIVLPEKLIAKISDQIIFRRALVKISGQLLSRTRKNRSPHSN